MDLRSSHDDPEAVAEWAERSDMGASIEPVQGRGGGGRGQERGYGEHGNQEQERVGKRKDQGSLQRATFQSADARQGRWKEGNQRISGKGPGCRLVRRKAYVGR